MAVGVWNVNWTLVQYGKCNRASWLEIVSEWEVSHSCGIKVGFRKSLGPAAINFPRENYTIKQMTQKTIYMPNAYE